MTKRQKLLQRLRNNPKNVSFEELRTLLEAYGFVHIRSKGSHHSFTVTIGGEELTLVIPYRRPHVKRGYVQDALQLIRRIEKEASDNE